MYTSCTFLILLSELRPASWTRTDKIKVNFGENEIISYYQITHFPFTYIIFSNKENLLVIFPPLVLFLLNKIKIFPFQISVFKITGHLRVRLFASLLGEFYAIFDIVSVHGTESSDPLKTSRLLNGFIFVQPFFLFLFFWVYCFFGWNFIFRVRVSLLLLFLVDVVVVVACCCFCCCCCCYHSCMI